MSYTTKINDLNYSVQSVDYTNRQWRVRRWQDNVGKITECLVTVDTTDPRAAIQVAIDSGEWKALA